MLNKREFCLPYSMVELQWIRSKAVRKWLSRLGVKTLFIQPGSPWENGYFESFNGKMRDELLDREIFTTLQEARVLIEQWRREYNQVLPHSVNDTNNITEPLSAKQLRFSRTLIVKTLA